MTTLARIVTGLSGAIVAVESLALLIGTRFSAGGATWAGPKNSLLALLDVAGGTGLIYVAVKATKPIPRVFYPLVLTLALTHGYREWEYLAGVDAPFCANAPLFAFNNIRLLGLILATVLASARAGRSAGGL